MGLLCSCALRTNCFPPSRVPATRDYRGAAGGLADLILSDGHACHWSISFATLTSRQRDNLAPMLMTIAIRRAVSRHDVMGVRALLERAVRTRLTRVPAVAQAGEFLRRTHALEPVLATPQVDATAT
jgi:hypothetical protein